MNPNRYLSTSILVLLGGGLILRLLMAYVILPDSYISGDVLLYASWANALVNVGFANLYTSVDGIDYPPGYLYILWFIGQVGRSVAAAAHMDPISVISSLIRVPSILLDTCTGFMLYLIARKWAANNPYAERIGLMATAVYLFNPVTWYDSAIWGQTDSIGTCLMLLAVIALTQWPSEIAAATAALAALVKPQFGAILVPLIGIVLLRRHLSLRDDFQPDTSLKRAYWRRPDGPIRLLTSALVATVVFYVLITPFHLDAYSFIQRMAKTAAGYPYLSVNAFNPWALVSSGRTPPSAFASPETFSSLESFSLDNIPLVGSLTGAAIGAGLLAIGFLLGGTRLLWRADRWSIVLVGALLSLCFFILPTRVHERYVFAAFTFSSLLAAFDRKWLWATVALAMASFMNLHGVLTMVDEDIGRRVYLPFSALFRTPVGVVLSIVLHTAVFFFVIWRLHPRAMQFEMRWNDADAGVPQSSPSSSESLQS